MAALTEEEVQLYDRQIRLWGMDTQAKLTKSRVLVIHLSPIHGELCKNLAAAGVNLILQDDRPYTQLATPLVIPPDDENEDTQGKTVAEVLAGRLRSMNSFIKVQVIKVPQLMQVCKEPLTAVAFPLARPEYELQYLVNLEELTEEGDPQPLCSFAYSGESTPVIMLTRGTSAKPTLRQMMELEGIDSEHMKAHKLAVHPRAAAAFARAQNAALEAPTQHEVMPSVAAILGGLIAQEIRRHVAAVEVTDWNVAAFSREITAVVVSDINEESVQPDEPKAAPTPLLAEDAVAIDSSSEEE